MPQPREHLWVPGRSGHRTAGRVSLSALAVLALVVGLGAPLAWLLASGSPPPPEPRLPVTAQLAPAPVIAVPSTSVTAVATVSPVAIPAPAAPPPQPAIARVREPGGDQTPDITDFINAGEVPTMKEVIARLHAAGVHSGLGAFSPPGTRPPLVGLAVPENFALPLGYVRHHQTTDDGQPIEPILMFAPDAQWVDAQGQTVALPADRVVPPELVPPGFPIRRIVVPAPVPPAR